MKKFPIVSGIDSEQSPDNLVHKFYEISSVSMT